MLEAVAQCSSRPIDLAIKGESLMPVREDAQRNIQPGHDERGGAVPAIDQTGALSPS